MNTLRRVRPSQTSSQGSLPLPASPERTEVDVYEHLFVGLYRGGTVEDPRSGEPGPVDGDGAAVAGLRGQAPPLPRRALQDWAEVEGLLQRLGPAWAELRSMLNELNAVLGR